MAKSMIKPSHKGIFTAKAKAHHETPTQFANQVLADKQDYSAATIKQAQFDKNQRKFKH